MYTNKPCYLGTGVQYSNFLCHAITSGSWNRIIVGGICVRAIVRHVSGGNGSVVKVISASLDSGRRRPGRSTARGVRGDGVGAPLRLRGGVGPPR